MKFTEPEMTKAVEAVARQLFAATRPPWRRGDHDQAWRELKAIERYNHLAAAGEVVLPVLVALPERPTVGATPEFTDEEYLAAAEGASRDLMEHRQPGVWESLGERKRRKLNQGTAELARVAVEGMPIRQDPDAFIVPDYLD